jgi:putative YhbY family RNA-binding protein
VALDATQIRFLRSLAHDLNPVVMIGQKGMSDGVRVELDDALSRHELVKIRVIAEEREERDEIIKALARDTRSELIQKVGHTATFYRRAKKAKILLPGEKPVKGESTFASRPTLDGQKPFRARRDEVGYGEMPRRAFDAADTRAPRRDSTAPKRAGGFSKRPPRAEDIVGAVPRRERSFGGRADGPTHRPARPARDFGDRPKRDFGDRPARPARDFGDRPARPARASAERPARPARDFGDRPKRDFGDRPARPARDFGDRPKRDFGDRPARPARDFGDRPARPARDFGDRPKRDFGDRPARPARAFGDRPARPARDVGDRPKRDFGDRPARPARAFGDRPARPARDVGDRPKRDFGDRPARASSGKPAYGSPRPAAKGPGSRPAAKPSGSPYKPLGSKRPKRETDED